ncbi:MAG: 6-phosphogluconolactonase [Acidimicrobiia bacterium]|nr:6-phosphogluconolactonase [Acidimicrobiia bacterium]
MNGELVVVDDVAQAFAERVVEAFRERPNEEFRIALSGGETARRCYERLATVGADTIDWWKVDIYWGDERAVPLDHHESNYCLARESLLEKVGAANMVYPMECELGADPYQFRIGELDAIDVIHLGLGSDGHTASLFPGSPALDADPGRLVVMNHDPSGNNPLERMTLTFSGIQRGRLVLVTVEGEQKSEALARVAAGDDIPAARVTAPELVWLADPAAAGALPR